MQNTLKSLLPFPVATNLHPFQKHLNKVIEKQYSCILKLNHHYALFCHCKTGVLYSPGYLFSLGACQPGIPESSGYQDSVISRFPIFHSIAIKKLFMFIFFQNLTKGEAIYKFEAIIVIKPVHNYSHIYVFFTWLKSNSFSPLTSNVLLH